MDVWSWICEIPDSVEFTESNSSPVFQLASSSPSQDGSARSIELRAERTTGSDPSLTFAVTLQGFHRIKAPNPLWISDACPLSSDKPFLPLLLQLLREILTLFPDAPQSSCPKSQLREIKPDPVSWVMDSHSPESFSSFFNIILLTRLFWACACRAPTEVGSFFFQSLLVPNIESFTCKHAPVLRSFFTSVGVDAVLCITRSVSYMLAKWLIANEIGGVGLQGLSPLPRQQIGFSYATEAHGLWILKGYFPILGMKIANSNDYNRKGRFPLMEAKEAVLRYALGHQQVEAVIQLEYSVRFHDSYIQVSTRVNNIRLHMVKLGFGNNNDDVDYVDERHFPSRVRVWVGPEVGSTYVAGLSLGRSTNNEEREIEVQKIIKGNFGKAKVPKVKARARMSTKMKLKNWSCDQDADGNAAVFDAILHDKETGEEVITLTPFNNDNNRFRNRYVGVNRGFTRNGGMVFAGDAYGDEVGWRINKEMEGSVLKWSIGAQIWLSYWPNRVKSAFYETRCVEWRDEVDLPLIPTK